MTCGRNGRFSSANPASVSAACNWACNVASAGGSADGATQATPEARQAPSVSKSSDAPSRGMASPIARNRRKARHRNVPQEREREVHVLAGDRASPRTPGDISRKCQELQPHRVVGHEGEERADAVWARIGGLCIDRSDRSSRVRPRTNARVRTKYIKNFARPSKRTKQKRGAASPRFHPDTSLRSSGYPFATTLTLSKNCSSSVEFLSAVVDAWLPWIVVVTASK